MRNKAFAGQLRVVELKERIEELEKKSREMRS